MPNAHIGSCDLDLVNNKIYWSDEVYRILKIEQEEARTCFETFLTAIHPDDQDRFSRAHAKAIEEKCAYDIVYRMLMKDGRIKHIHQYCEPSCDETGRVIRAIHTVQDITQFHKMELALQKLNRSLKALSACNEAVMRTTDEAELLNKVCNIIVTLTGYPLAWVGFLEHDQNKSIHPKAFAGNDPCFLVTLKVSWRNDVHGQNPAGVAIRTGVPDCVQHITTKQPDALPWRESSARHGYRSMVALPLIEKEEVFGALNIYAAAADAFDSEEVQLLQKMEAIGQLAGGIAHDYNNWLGVIMGYLDFLKDHLAGTEEPSKWVRAAIKAAQHSANLTRQLLVFVRQHPTTKSVTDVNKVIREIGDLIESSVTPEVEVDYLLDETLWRVEVRYE
ncbi:PAS domain-containing protein [Nitrospira defluvii]|nr:PAS domain-containing protein [Nitrospira defluvii]